MCIGLAFLTQFIHTTLYYTHTHTHIKKIHTHSQFIFYFQTTLSLQRTLTLIHKNHTQTHLIISVNFFFYSSFFLLYNQYTKQRI